MPRTSRPGAALLVGGIVVSAMWAIAMSGAGGEVPGAMPVALPQASPVASPSPKPAPANTSGFAPSACVSLAPLRGDARATVFLDAGHGGLDPGAAGRTSRGARIEEKTAALLVVQATADRLRAAGYRVVLSRSADTTAIVPRRQEIDDSSLTGLGVHRDLLARVACANQSHADALISIHMNAFSDPDEGGTITLYDPGRPFSRASLRLARLLHTRVLAALRREGVDIQDRFVLPDTVSFGRKARLPQSAKYGREVLLGPRAPGWVPEASAMPGAILELLFITRPVEADIVASIEGRAAVSEAISSAIREFLSSG